MRAPATARDLVKFWVDFLLWTLGDTDKTQEDITIENFARWLSKRVL